MNMHWADVPLISKGQQSEIVYCVPAVEKRDADSHAKGFVRLETASLSAKGQKSLILIKHTVWWSKSIV